MLTNGVKVALAGSVVNFCLGIFYAWSVFADGLINELGWSRSAAMLPYTLELLVFSIAMIFGGRFQDRFGPRRGLTLSGIFTGLALILCALTASPIGVTLSFGIIFGSAAAFGYSAVTPAVLSWFPPRRRGLVTGLILMSLGAAALVWAPVINLLLVNLGIIKTFVVCGLLIFLAISVCSRAVVMNTSLDEQPVEIIQPAEETTENTEKIWRLVIRKPAFRTLWLMIGLSSGIGFMFIGHLVQIAELNFNITWGYVFVSLFALTNALGRLAGGALCDRIGYIDNFKTALCVMVVAMLLFLSGLGWPALVSATVLLGLSYGSLYTSFPVIVADIFGLKNFGINYGMIFTAIGIVGSLGPLIAAYLAELAASYYPAFILGLIAALVCFALVENLKKMTAPN